LQFAEQALTIQKSLDDSRGILYSLINIAEIYDSVGQFKKALAFLNQALDLCKPPVDPQESARCLFGLGVEYEHLGSPDKAQDFFDRALTIWKAIGKPRNIGNSLLALGQVSILLGRCESAVDLCKQALDKLRVVGNPQEVAGCLNDLGEAYRHLKKWDEAERAFSESRQLREALTYQVGDPSQVGLLQETFGRFYERYAHLLVDRNRPEDALEMLEAGRGMGLARQIDLNHRGDLTRFFTEQEHKTLVERTEALDLGLSALRQAQRQLEAATEPQRIECQNHVDLARQREQLAEQEYDMFREALFARHPEFKRIATAQPALFSELQALARDHPDTLYLEYAIVDDGRSLLFTLSKRDGLKCIPLSTGYRALTELAKNWRDALEGAAGRGPILKDSSDNAPGRSGETAFAKEAYVNLLGDAEKAGLLKTGRYKRLVIVGSGPIMEMPLAALCDGDGKRLVERYSLSNSISLSVFFWRANPIVPKDSLIAIADPTGPRKEVTTLESKKDVGVVLAAANANNRPKSLFRSDFKPLPGARVEGRSVAALFPGSMLLVGPDANESTVTRLLPRYGILHFATHGFVVPKAALSSGLALAEEATSSKYDGLLTARKIMSIPLSARLAVLSGCDTGRGSVQGGEGLIGLAWAFRAAGCSALLASQWQVNDVATKEWMLSFYRALKAGRPKDEAVQTAMLEVKTNHPSPYYWAAFEMIGDASPLVRR